MKISEVLIDPVQSVVERLMNESVPKVELMHSYIERISNGFKIDPRKVIPRDTVFEIIQELNTDLYLFKQYNLPQTVEMINEILLYLE